ncbi:uncharacterized protein FIBRA_01397 [Fibroporia radiculosa]|uniref:Uncharacterized protein n=1 Tax=Fibroporia radiculosa TaxID=599839 RepID=J4H135_9APHY|nr:uncharacterized protein FIBRA_01397 [Fibroporia radiculosa]CCL99379.1 predicted protein [Fibroporia radiculosa]
MSSKGNPVSPPKYINDFSKALASEVRILLQEVGKLRDERRALQYEIAELMSVKSKHGAGGEYTPDWKPRHEEPPMPIEPSPGASPGPPPPPALPEGPARPGWRTVNKREERRQKAKAKALPPPEPVQAIPEPPAPNLPAWAQWKPNPLLSPQPLQANANSPMLSDHAPSRVGLFGPPTPPPK